MELMEHQMDAIDHLGNGKILWGNVGSGKSAAVLGYYMKHEAPRHIFVITTAKKRDTLDWEGEAAKFGIGSDPSGEDTLAGVINVDSWNNMWKYTDIEDAFFIFRRAETGWVRVLGEEFLQDHQEEPLGFAVRDTRGYLAGLCPSLHRERLLQEHHAVQV